MGASSIKESLQLDVLTLGVYVRSKKNVHSDGAYARFKGLPLRDTDPRWVNGWKWADRIIQGLEKVYGSGSEGGDAPQWLGIDGLEGGDEEGDFDLDEGRSP